MSAPAKVTVTIPSPNGKPAPSPNVKGNRQVVQTSYTLHSVFKIPDGLDLNGDTVERWWVKYGTLYIKYVGKEEVEEIEASWDAEDSCDFKYGQDEVLDADEVGFEYSEDEESDEEN